MVHKSTIPSSGGAGVTSIDGIAGSVTLVAGTGITISDNTPSAGDITITSTAVGGVSSVSNSDGTLTVSPTTGAVVASIALGHANTWSGQQTFVAPALGTPASGVLTNCTGTASGLTAGTVTTNANLTGPITSTGNAVSSLTQFNVLLGAGASAIQYAAPSTIGFVLTDNGTGANPTFKANNAKVRTIGFSTISAATGQQGSYVVFPVAGTITGWSIVANAGTCTVQTWKIASGTAAPTSGNSISTTGVSLASGTAIISSTVTDFTTTTVTANDIFAFNVSAISGASLIDFQLQITVT